MIKFSIKSIIIANTLLFCLCYLFSSCALPKNSLIPGRRMVSSDFVMVGENSQVKRVVEILSQRFLEPRILCEKELMVNGDYLQFLIIRLSYQEGTDIEKIASIPRNLDIQLSNIQFYKLEKQDLR